MPLCSDAAALDRKYPAFCKFLTEQDVGGGGGLFVGVRGYVGLGLGGWFWVGVVGCGCLGGVGGCCHFNLRCFLVFLGRSHLFPPSPNCFWSCIGFSVLVHAGIAF